MTYRILRWVGIGALVIAYPFLAHYTNQTTQNGNLGALVAITPVVIIALMLAWRSPHRLIMLSALTASCFALWAGWSTLTSHFGVVYWLQHVAMQLILFMAFARTLVAGRKPLCTIFAETVHAPLSPEHVIYARQVTVAWTVFFAAMALISTLLFFLAPLKTWSFFSNFLTLPLVGAMFIAEYWVRRTALPESKSGILDAVRAFRKSSARPR